jgi:Immunity protein 8
VPIVIADVKGMLFFGAGASGDRDEFHPVDPRHFGVSVQVFIGDTQGEHGDSFDLTVCSPSWLASTFESEGTSRFAHGLWTMPATIVVGAQIWLMPAWNANDFRAGVDAVCASASPGPDWGAVANRIGRLIPWEFAYKYDDHIDRHPNRPFPPSVE